jgi:hypothetical protein
VIIDTAGECALVLDEEWAGEQNLAARAASVALAMASAGDACTILLGQHRPHDGTSDLTAQLNQHLMLLFWVHAPRPSTSAAKTMSKVAKRASTLT